MFGKFVLFGLQKFAQSWSDKNAYDRSDQFCNLTV